MAFETLKQTARLGEEPLRDCEIFPTPARVVGPGRLERGYQARVAELERARAILVDRAHVLARELAVAEHIERGSGRLVDRLERDLERERLATAELQGGQKRLLLALGAVQRDNQALRGALAALRDRPTPALAPARRRGWLARLLGRA